MIPEDFLVRAPSPRPRGVPGESPDGHFSRTTGGSGPVPARSRGPDALSRVVGARASLVAKPEKPASVFLRGFGSDRIRSPRPPSESVALEEGVWLSSLSSKPPDQRRGFVCRPWVGLGVCALSLEERTPNRTSLPNRPPSLFGTTHVPCADQWCTPTSPWFIKKQTSSKCADRAPNRTFLPNRVPQGLFPDKRPVALDLSQGVARALVHDSSLRLLLRRASRAPFRHHPCRSGTCKWGPRPLEPSAGPGLEPTDPLGEDGPKGPSVRGP